MNFDLVIIGTGPGGYVCAIRAAQLGLKVAVVEKRATHGGTCLNVGCIPSKALLHSSELFSTAQNHFEEMGIEISAASINLPKMMAFKQQAIDGNTKGIDFLFKKNKITPLHGIGKILSPHRVLVEGADGTTQELETRFIVIATGSESASLPNIKVDEKRIVTSTGALTLEKVPDHLAVIGAGVIGLELGSVWQRLGAKVTFVEFQDRILQGMDLELSKTFQRILARQGMQFKLGTKVQSVSEDGESLSLLLREVGGAGEEQLNANVVLVATGRIPYTSGLGLQDLGVVLDERARVVVNHRFETNVSGIFAIGDVIKGPMLAHKAEDEGVAVAEILAGQAGAVNEDVIPSVVYTSPEVASVGKTEEELKSLKTPYKIGKFLFAANGRAKANKMTDGFVKILADEKTDRVLGVHMIGAHVGELIHECAVLMEFSGSSEDLARICHAHPTFSEAVREAAMAVEQRAIHS